MRKKTSKSPKLRNLKCYVCGKKFRNRVAPSEIKKKRMVCSKECKAKLISMDKRRGKYLKCKRCGKKFFASPSVIKRGRKYCSNYCYHPVKTGESIASDGYYVYSSQKVHRQIMEKHLGRKLLPEEIVHHKDEDKLNNDIENLEVMTRAEHNKLHQSFGGKGESHINSKLTKTDVKIIRASALYGVMYTDLARVFSVSISTISHIVKRKTWKHV